MDITANFVLLSLDIQIQSYIAIYSFYHYKHTHYHAPN